MRSRYYTLDQSHRVVPCPDVLTWGRFFENDDMRRVALTETADWRVSTVFIGLDHRFSGDGPPLVFETMIFGGPHDEYQEHYSTWDEAKAGHEKAVDLADGVTQ